MDSVRWGVLGNSTIGRKCMLPAIRKSTNGTIWALASLHPEDAREVVQDNQIEHLYGDYDRIIEDPEIDAVYIPLPNHLHRPWALKALNGGKHVLCEKPLACTAAEAQEMTAAARSNNRLLMEGLMYRFHPRSRKVKEMIAAGAIGVPRLIRAAFCFAMAPSLLESGDNYRLKSQAGAGALMDVGCYGVSVARWLFDAEPVAVQAQAIYQKETGVDIQVVGSLRFDNDCLASFEAGFCAGLQQTYTIIGSKGAIELPHDAFIPWEKEAMIEHRTKDQEVGEMITIPGSDEYLLMVEHFAGAILQGREPAVSPDDSINNLVVLDALAESARSGFTVFLNTEQTFSLL
ncbi:MAG: Gfo/Idh/MocA family oxidoreductase [Desulforhopalus sp.]